MHADSNMREANTAPAGSRAADFFRQRSAGAEPARRYECSGAGDAPL
jgi:hypothetical protein